MDKKPDIDFALTEVRGPVRRIIHTPEPHAGGRPWLTGGMGIFAFHNRVWFVRRSVYDRWFSI